MPNISNLIIKARKYLEQGNIQELSQLIDENPNLISEKFEIEESENRKNGVTLLIEAFRHLNIKGIEMLLDKGANIKTVDDTGKTSILHLFNIQDYDQEKTIQDQKEHDKKVVEILKLLKEKYIPIDCFTVQDSNDKTTPLIRAVLANLTKSTNFIIELLEDNNLLKEQVTHKDRKGSDVLDHLLYAKVHSKEPCNESFTEKN